MGDPLGKSFLLSFAECWFSCQSILHRSTYCHYKLFVILILSFIFLLILYIHDIKEITTLVKKEEAIYCKSDFSPIFGYNEITTAALPSIQSVSQSFSICFWCWLLSAWFVQSVLFICFFVIAKFFSSPALSYMFLYPLIQSVFWSFSIYFFILAIF